MQKAFIAGNVTSTKDLRDVGANKVFSFSVAVNNGKDKNTGDWKPSSFYDCSVWGARGEAMSRFLTKGTKVAVSGRLQPPRVHEGKAYLSVDADEVTLLGGGESGGQQQPQQENRQPPEPQDEIPF